jgi:hypothetical protein
MPGCWLFFINLNLKKMANNALSLLVTAQALLTNKYAAPEMRHKDYAITRILLANSDVMVPNALELKTSDQRAVEAYAFIKPTSDPVTTRHATGAATASAFGDTQKVALSWVTRGQLFKASMKMADRNYMTAAAMLSNRMEAAWIHLLDTIEALNAAYLGTNKSQVQAGSDGELGTWDSSNYVWQIDNLNKNWFFQYIQSMMAINNYSGMMDFIADPVAFAISQQLAAQGSGNSTNTQFTIGDLKIAQSTSLAPVSGYQGYGYIIPSGTVGLLTWVPKANRENRATRLQTYTTMNDPFGLGITGALHIYENKADNSIAGGELQDENVEYELTVDLSGVKAPLSVTNETTIFEAALLTGGGN